MRFCMECGEKLNDDQKFCPICGTKIPDEMVQKTEQTSFLNEPVSQPKKSKIGIIIAICAGLLAAGAIVLVLFLSGVFSKCSNNRETVLAPSKDKLITLEERCMNEVWDTMLGAYAEFQKVSFDAEITLEMKSEESTGGLDISDILNNAKLEYHADNTDGRNIGMMLTLWGNPVLDLRVFDLDQKTISFYCSPGSDKLYIMSLDVLLNNLMAEQNSGISVDSILELMFSDHSEELLRSDYDAFQKAILNTIAECDVDIQTKQEISLFNGEENINCEVYTLQPTKEQIETCLNRLADIIENGNGILSQTARAAGATADDMQDLRKEIPTIAQEVFDSNLVIQVAMVGNDIVRQSVKNDQFNLTIDVNKTESQKRMMVLLTGEERLYFNVIEDRDGQIRVEAEFGDEIKITGSCDDHQKSLIGTCAGHFDLYVDSEKMASIDIEPSENGMMHTITVYEDILYMGFEDAMKVHIDVKPGTGVQRPSGAETVDISNYSPEELEQLLQKLIAPLMLLMQMKAYGY